MGLNKERGKLLMWVALQNTIKKGKNGKIVDPKKKSTVEWD